MSWIIDLSEWDSVIVSAKDGRRGIIFRRFLKTEGYDFINLFGSELPLKEQYLIIMEVDLEAVLEFLEVSKSQGLLQVVEGTNVYTVLEIVK